MSTTIYNNSTAQTLDHDRQQAYSQMLKGRMCVDHSSSEPITRSQH